LLLLLLDTIEPILLDSGILTAFLLFGPPTLLFADIRFGRRGLFGLWRYHNRIVCHQHALDSQRYSRSCPITEIQHDNQRTEQQHMQ
jgi:hypothetical protein